MSTVKEQGVMVDVMLGLLPVQSEELQKAGTGFGGNLGNVYQYSTLRLVSSTPNSTYRGRYLTLPYTTL